MRAGLWLAGAVGSVLLHLGGIFLLGLSVTPELPEQPDLPQTNLTMQTQPVAQQNAIEREVEGRLAETAQGETTKVASAGIRSARAAPLLAKTVSAAALSPQTTAATPQDTSGAPLAAVNAAQASQAAVITPQTTALNTVSMTNNTAPNITPEAQAVQSQDPSAVIVAASDDVGSTSIALPAVAQTTELATAEPQGTELGALSLPAGQAARITPVSIPTAAASPPLTAVPSSSAPTISAPTTTATGTVIAPSSPPAQSFAAIDAPVLSDRIITDSASIAAYQALTEEGGGTELRDALSQTLEQTDCARISASFQPETGTLELRGHVPEDAARGPIVKALQAQMGVEIAVSDELLILPEPQCGALADIASVGLPQSTDQITNDRLIGKDAHVREYRYTAGDRLAFDLVAPDYDAVIYVDYFDAAGQVIHLTPNEFIALKTSAAKSELGIGREIAGEPGLNITIGPPFGQEIAVAFAASRPLYEGLRPTSEPAAPYLEFLKAQISKAREEDETFKGEWVYFFITTQAAIQ